MGVSVKRIIEDQIDWYTYYRDELKQWSPVMQAKLEVYNDMLMLLEHAEANGGEVTKSLSALQWEKGK